MCTAFATQVCLFDLAFGCRVQELDNLLKLCDSLRAKYDDLDAHVRKWENPDEITVEDVPKKIEEAQVRKRRVRIACDVVDFGSCMNTRNSPDVCVTGGVVSAGIQVAS